MTEQLVFYDIANKQNVTFSPNPWKTRLALNFKSLPYRTEWVEYPDLAPKFQSFGIPPNPDDPEKFTDYSSPVVRFADGIHVMDSLRIAERLETIYPEPSMHLDTGLHRESAAIVFELSWLVFPDMLHLLPKEILNERSASWFAEDRKRRWGITLDELAEKNGGEKAWASAVPVMTRLKAFLTENKRDQGPFILGSTPSYGDLYIIALFQAAEVVSKGMYEKIVGFDQAFRDLHEAGRKWTLKSD